MGEVTASITGDVQPPYDETTSFIRPLTRQPRAYDFNRVRRIIKDTVIPRDQRIVTLLEYLFDADSIGPWLPLPEAARITTAGLSEWFANNKPRIDDATKDTDLRWEVANTPELGAYEHVAHARRALQENPLSAEALSAYAAAHLIVYDTLRT